MCRKTTGFPVDLSQLPEGEPSFSHIFSLFDGHLSIFLLTCFIFHSLLYCSNFLGLSCRLFDWPYRPDMLKSSHDQFRGSVPRFWALHSEADAITLSPADVANDTAVEVAALQLTWIGSGEGQQCMIFFGS